MPTTERMVVKLCDKSSRKTVPRECKIGGKKNTGINSYLRKIFKPKL
jgi:hypothetical protein